MTEFKNFTKEDWMSFGGAIGLPLIAHLDPSHFVGDTASSIDIVADAQSITVVIFTTEYECHNFVNNQGGLAWDLCGAFQGPTDEQMEIAEKARAAVGFAKNHLELIGALVLAGFEVL